MTDTPTSQNQPETQPENEMPENEKPENEKPENGAPTNEKKTAGTETDAKRRFQEALERKAAVSRSRQAHEDGRLKLKGFSGPKGQNRTFRRKSG
ncbi:DUF5302 domain-containing protein [Streptomyces sp. AC602_WCS936]|uniref:DUF5302 domain-containing protein n=1 Tax=Streptomyces sp. AC602_WCS936 TaxID=2823685 RepID=UPI001C26F912|nr:DUF5302 domain-containing protein [Streptomyces sp. AC602_WCS936]